MVIFINTGAFPIIFCRVILFFVHRKFNASGIIVFGGLYYPCPILIGSWIRFNTCIAHEHAMVDFQHLDFFCDLVFFLFFIIDYHWEHFGVVYINPIFVDYKQPSRFLPIAIKHRTLKYGSIKDGTFKYRTLKHGAQVQKPQSRNSQAYFLRRLFLITLGLQSLFRVHRCLRFLKAILYLPHQADLQARQS